MRDHTKEAREKDEGRTAEAEKAAAEAFTIHARYKGIHPPPEIEDGVSTRLSRVNHYLENFRIQASANAIHCRPKCESILFLVHAHVVMVRFNSKIYCYSSEEAKVAFRHVPPDPFKDPIPLEQSFRIESLFGRTSPVLIASTINQ